MEELVERAARNAAQAVGRIHRRRLVTQAFIAGLVAACFVCIPIVLFNNAARAKVGIANNRYNCSQWHEGATVLAEFLRTDANLREQQQDFAERAEVITGLNKIISSETVKTVLARSDKLDRQTQRYWTKALVPRLNALANVNCQAALTKDGPTSTPTSTPISPPPPPPPPTPTP